MKNFNFVYVEKSRVISRTYGGSTYVLAVYEVVKNELLYLGEIKACTRGHMGETHEAWTVVKRERPNVVKLLDRRIKKAGQDKYYTPVTDNYYKWQYREFGVQLKQA